MSDLHRVRVWADALIAHHLDDSWSFGFDNAKRRAGQCDYTRKRISVSRYLAARYDDDTNHQTLLHEVAHALAGASAGHGTKWKSVARELGYVGGTTHHGETATELAPWIGRVPRRPRRLPAPAGDARRPRARSARRGSTSASCSRGRGARSVPRRGSRR